MAIFPALILMATMFLVAPVLASLEDKGYTNPHLLAETEWLDDNIDSPSLRIVDLRPFSDYKAGHIKNAIHLDVSSLRTTVEGIPGMMVGTSELERTLSAKGLGNENQIVAYDNAGGLFASRFFLTLTRYGHNAVRVLDGGIRKWVSEGRPLTTTTPSYPQTSFRAGYPSDNLVTAKWIEENLDNSAVALVDARSAEEYSGEMVRAARGGHIPGAANINWIDNLSKDETAQFKPQKELLEIYQQAGITKDKLVITYCQSGMRASHTYFTLLLLGYQRVKVYDGSWLEWGNRQSLPIE